MAIEVHCQCGRFFSLGPELAGKKLRCKSCGVVLKVPALPVPVSGDSGPPSMEYELLKEELACPTCGAGFKPGDPMCLSCGANLGDASPGLLERVPKPVLIGIVAVLVLGIGGGFGFKLYSSSKLAGLLSQGREKLERGDLKGARALFDEALSRSGPEDTAAREGLVDTGKAGSDWKLVRTHAPALLTRLQRGDKRARVKVDLARAYLELGDNPGAQRTAKSAREDDDKIEGATEIEGLALLAANEKLAAVEVLKKAASEGSRDARVYMGLAHLAEGLGTKEGLHEARGWADKAIAHAGKDVSIFLECGHLRDRDGDKASAIAAYKQATEADPSSAAALVELADALLDAKDPEEALKSAEKANTLAQGAGGGGAAAGASRVLGEAQLEVRELLKAKIARAGENAAKTDKDRAEKLLVDAKKELERAESLAAGDDGAASFLLGKALVRSGDVEGGTSRFDRALRKKEKDALAWLEAGRLLLLEVPTQPDRAVPFLEKAVSLEPKPLANADKKAFAEAKLLLARALGRVDGGRTKYTKRIEDTLKSAIELEPKNREPYLELGLQNSELDNHVAALAILEKAAAALPDDDEILYRAGVAAIKARKENFKKAVDILSKLVARNPDYPDAKNKLDTAKYGLEFESGN